MAKRQPGGIGEEDLLGSVHRIGQGSKGAQMRCGIVRTPVGYIERKFVTPQYAVVFLPYSSGWYTDHRGREFRLEAGCLFQRFPSQPHQIRFEERSIHCFVGVPCQVFELFALTGLTHRERPVLSIGAGEELVHEFVRIREELRAQSEEGLARMLLRMQAFIAGLLERGRAKDDGASEPIATAMQLLNEDLAQRLHLPDIARRVNMSYSLFRKRFMERAGTSPGDYRILRRIERAMALLTKEKLLVKEVAAQLGYPDEYAFSAQFKKVAGVSPTIFRQRHG
jgi:AraC-like DNA-binding protein